MNLKKIIVIGIVFGSIVANASDKSSESWNVDGKVFTSKPAAVRYVMALGKRVSVEHTRCEILTNKLTFKACPKSKESSYDNEQFSGLNK